MRQDGPRPSNQRPDNQRPDNQRQEGPRPGGSFQPRPRQDDQGGRPFQGHRQPDRSQHRPPQSPDTPRGTVWLYGYHAIAAALANPARRLRRLVVTEDAEAELLSRRPQPWPLQPERVDRGRLDHLLGRDIAHQGVALLADPLSPPSLQAVLERSGPLLVLDQVTDPRNVGAILRSAAAFGAAAVITQDRNAPEETGALAKAASGALETMPLLRAVNIARTLIALKAANVWTVGLDAAAKAPLSGPVLAGRRVALVLGAEGEGLRRLTRETCDELAGLAMPGGMESLNVSAAAAVALYELTRQP
jgi:23S rRNA (guanosine2251-2'-O)-methyltransferase